MSSVLADPVFAPARAHAPAALAMLDAASVAAREGLDHDLALFLESRVGAELRGDVGSPGPAQAVTAREEACCAFADQFVVYVPGVTAAQRDAVTAHLGERRLLELARMLYVFDMTCRLELALGQLFGTATAGEVPALAEPLELGSALEGLHASAMLLHALDPVTTELVRLHCARYHDCKT